MKKWTAWALASPDEHMRAWGGGVGVRDDLEELGWTRLVLYKTKRQAMKARSYDEKPVKVTFDLPLRIVVSGL